MKYRNERTGAVIETASVISGGDWKPVEENPAPNPEPAKKAATKTTKPKTPKK